MSLCMSEGVGGGLGSFNFLLLTLSCCFSFSAVCSFL